MLNAVNPPSPAWGGRARAYVARVGRAALSLARSGLIVARAGSRPVAGALRRVTVVGSSMEPALAAGDRIVVIPAVRLRPGHVVAFMDPRDPARLLVKRVVSIDPGSELIWVEGDNPGQSTDSRVFGSVRRRAVMGRAVYRYAPTAHAGPVAGRR